VNAGLPDELVGGALDVGVNFSDTGDVYAGGESATNLKLSPSELAVLDEETKLIAVLSKLVHRR
jgi:hypothetical protein